MSTATSPRTAPVHPTVSRPDITTVGFIVWLSSELMFFAALFAMYFTIRSVVPEQWEEGTGFLKVPFALTITLILVSSSITCQIGVWKAEEKFQPFRTGPLWKISSWGMVEWFYVTFFLGAVFVSGQVMEYAILVSEGVAINSNGFASVFFMTTGFHGIHVIGGLIAFLFVIGRAYGTKKFGHREATFAACVSYYWHFVDVVWIALFLIIYALQ